MPVPTVVARRSASRAVLFAASSLAVAGLMLGTLAGCEGDMQRADQAALDSIHEVENERGEAAIKGFEKAAKEAGTSPAASVNAKVLLAQAEVEQARMIDRQVAANELQIGRLVADITDIGGQIHSNNIAIAGYQEVSPKGTGAVAKLLEGTRTSARGNGDDAVWQVGKDAEVPALSNAQARAKALEPQVAEMTAQRDKLTADRKAAEVKSSQLLLQSKRKTGKESLDLFTQSSNEAKRSADLANQIAQVNHKLAAVEQQAALANAQAERLQAAVGDLGKRIGATKESQAQIEKLVEQHRALSAALVGGDGSAPAPAGDKGDTAAPPADAPAVEKEAPAEPAAFQESAETPAAEAPADGAAPAEAAPAEAAPADAPPSDAAAPVPTGPPPTIVTNVSMADKAKELSDRVTDTAAKRKAVIDLLNSAIGHYDSALSDAQKLRSELDAQIRESGAASSPQARAWKDLQAVYDPARLNLAKAGVQQFLADVHRDATASLAARKRMLSVVKPALTEAGIALPAGLDEPEVDTQLQASQQAAAEGYEAVRKLLDEEVIAKGGSSSVYGDALGNSAQVASVLSLYGQAQLAAAVDDAPTAEKLMTSARQAVTGGTLVQEAYPTSVLTALDLRSAAAPTTGPTTAPSRPTPAAAPAEPGAPAEAPAEGTPATPPAADAPAETPAAPAPAAQ